MLSKLLIRLVLLERDAVGADLAARGQRSQGRAAPFQGIEGGSALMMTKALASGGSSVSVNSIFATMPLGTILSSWAKAPPVSTSVGYPLAKFTTPRSRQ